MHQRILEVNWNVAELLGCRIKVDDSKLIVASEVDVVFDTCCGCALDSRGEVLKPVLGHRLKI
jgi:hypothetical protein